MNEQIIVDTDPGIDDTLALIYSHCIQLPVVAVSTVYGNASLQNVTRNAGYIVKSLGNKWKIYEGSNAPLSGKAHLAKSHGIFGLGTVKPKGSEIVKPISKSSYELFSGLNAKTRNTVFCLGPLTNIALALTNSTIVQNIDRLIIMGGAFFERGNVTDYAEFNSYNDPEAFQIVMDQAMNHGIDTVIIPAEICRKVTLTKRDLKVLDGKTALKALQQIVAPYIDYYTTNKAYGNYGGAVLYDVLVPLYYEHSELFEVVASRVSIELHNKTRKGQTIASVDPGSPIKICSNIDAIKAKNVIMRALTQP